MGLLRWAFISPMVAAGLALHAAGAVAEETGPPDAPATKSLSQNLQGDLQSAVSAGSETHAEPGSGTGSKGKFALEVTAKKTEDRVEVETREDAAALIVTSPRGIGAATVSLKEGQWPRRVVLRLRLKGLESLTISNGKITLEASVSSHGDQGQRIYRKDGDREHPVEKGGQHWMEIKIIGGEKVPLKDGYFEVVLPQSLLKDGPKALTVRWIDFYRG